MSIRGIGDAYAFQRLLWLLVGTVIIPTSILAVYGLYAIRNTRAALLQRAAAERQAQLQEVAKELLPEVERIEGGVRRGVEACPESAACPLPEAGVAEAWVWPVQDPPPGDLAQLGIPPVLGPQTVWVVPHDGSAPLGLFVQGTHRVAWRADLDHLDAFVQRQGTQQFPEAGTFGLEVLRPGPATTFEELVRRWQQPEFVATLPLERPLTHWRLTAEWGEDEPYAQLLAWTSWIQLAGLIALVGIVVTGTVVTLRSTLREIRLSRLQTDFVSRISHELRTPLTSIRMFVETLQSGRLADDPDRIAECLDLMAQESDRLSRRIERVLNWARMEAGRRVYDLEEVSAQEIVQEALTAFRSHNLLRGGEEITVDLPEDLPPLHADRDAVVEALLNLVQNAVRYSEPPRHVRVFAVGHGGWVGLGVEDDGPGIPRRERRRIFEKFYQADPLLSRKTQGSGLGLAIVRAVVQGHGGRVSLWSEVGEGSRFTMWLPPP